jgi:uncharacterized protein DUF3365
MSRSRFAIILGGLLLSAAAIGAAQTHAVWTSWPIRQAPAEWRPIVSRADVIIVAMQDSLLRQLHDKLAEGGPALAFGACHMETTELTRRIGRNEGIAAGFTSGRLRNPTNRPRDWAADIVASYADRRARDIDGFAVDLGDRIGVLRPMVEQETCANCHGPLERLTPAVRRLLAERYPHDRATGFAEGDIRGWFWIEMRKPARSARF